MNALLALLGSTIIGLSIIFLMDALDTTVVDSEHLQRELRVPLLPTRCRWVSSPWERCPCRSSRCGPGCGRFAEISAKETLAAPNAAFDEAIRTLRSSILLSAGLEHHPKSILVTSASPAEGKSTIALYLAAAHSQQQRQDAAD